MVMIVLIAAPWVGTLAMRFDSDLTAESDAGHLRFLLSTWELFLDAPLVGIGWDNLRSVTGLPHAHNVYMTIAAETGIAGLVLWLGLCLSLLHRAVHGARMRGTSRFVRYANLGLLGAWVAVLVGNVFQESYHAGFTWIVAAMIVAGDRIARREVQ